MNKFLNFLGIAVKSGSVVSGEFSTENAIREGKARLVIVASDASDNTSKKFHDKCTFYHVPILSACTRDELGHAIGKSARTSLAVTDERFAEALISKFGNNSAGE